MPQNKKNKNKKVYVALSVDFLHEGHLNILKTASKYGQIIVGLLTDKAVASYKPLPVLDFEKRKAAEEKKQEYLKKIYAEFLEIKKGYPTCIYDPPRVLSCDSNCPNPLCPGKLLPNKKYSKMKEEPKNEVINL